MAEEKTYQPHFVQEGDDKGRVAKESDAQEMAHLENAAREADDSGKVEAKAKLDKDIAEMESDWKKEDTFEGMTPAESANIKILESLTTKPDTGEPINTHAFVDKVDSKGRQYRILRNSDRRLDTGLMDNEEREFFGWVYFFTKDGPFMVNIRQFGSSVKDTNEVIDTIDWGKLGDSIEDPAQFPKDKVNMNIELPIIYDGQEDTVDSGISRYDVRLDQKKLARAIKFAEKIGVEQAKRTQEKVVNVDDTLRGLLG